MWFLLNERLWFPDPRRALDFGAYRGLVALGGDLSLQRLLLAYRSGIFPWTSAPLTWWSPDPRGIIELDQFHTSTRLEKLLRQGRFQVTRDRAFRAVMEGCAAPAPGRTSTWITAEFIDAYVRLHEAGYAHSVECWAGHDLVGGIYGVHLGGLFAGESMFHRVSNASKVALCSLVQHLRTRDIALFDIQIVSPHTRQFGASEISRDQYLERLRRAVELPRTF